MGSVERDEIRGTLTVWSEIRIYGSAANAVLASRIAEEIGSLWNEPAAMVTLGRRDYRLRFEISGSHCPDLGPDEIHANLNPRLNFFRVEPFARDQISFVDETGSNTGYFKLDNLLNQSTTAAHEYGHSIGLKHPERLDIRGMGQPGIMYPRGTWVDPPFQYDPAALPGKPGGTLNPALRKVTLRDIARLRLDTLRFQGPDPAILGDFTNLYHEPH